LLLAEVRYRSDSTARHGDRSGHPVA